MDVRGTVNPRGDNDYYRFVITTAGTLSITLGTLPANYDRVVQTANWALNILTLSQSTHALRMRNVDGTVSTVKVVKY